MARYRFIWLSTLLLSVPTRARAEEHTVYAYCMAEDVTSGNVGPRTVWVSPVVAFTAYRESGVVRWGENEAQPLSNAFVREISKREGKTVYPSGWRGACSDMHIDASRVRETRDQTVAHFRTSYSIQYVVVEVNWSPTAADWKNTPASPSTTNPKSPTDSATPNEPKAARGLTVSPTPPAKPTAAELKAKAERARREEQTRAVQRAQETSREENRQRAISLASSLRQERDLAKGAKNSCTSKPSPPKETSAFGMTITEAKENLAKWTARVCGGHPAKTSTVTCSEPPYFCSTTYTCPSRPVACSGTGVAQ